MKKRARGDTGAETGATEDIEAAVRAAAQSIAERFESPYPDFEDLAEDEEFLSASQRLAETDVAFETVERLGRASSPIVAAMAHRAAWLRDDVPAGWSPVGVSPPEARVRGRGPLPAAGNRAPRRAAVHRASARAGRSRLDRGLAPLGRHRVRRAASRGGRAADGGRLRAGGQGSRTRSSSPTSWPHWRVRCRRRPSASSSSGGNGALGSSSSSRSAGSGSRGPRAALTTVGGRAAVVAELRAVLRRQGARSALVVGEHGVGKSAVIREALREFHGRRLVRLRSQRRRRPGGAEVHRRAARPRARDRRPDRGPAQRLGHADLRGRAVGRAAHPQRAGAARRAAPFVETGQLVVVGELEPRTYELLVQQRPRVTSLFETLRLEPLTSEECDREWRATGGTTSGADIDDVTIGEAQDLAAQYLAGAGSPAGLLRLLKATVADAAGRRPMNRFRRSRSSRRSRTQPGCRSTSSTPRRRSISTRCGEFFSTRVLGQQEAVDCSRRPDRADQGEADRPDAAARRLPVRRPDGNGQDGAREGARGVPLRLAGAPRATRHERVPDRGQPGAPARRLELARRGRDADLVRAREAVLGGAPRRVREGAPQLLERLPPALRRRPADGSPGQDRRLSPVRRDPHVERRLPRSRAAVHSGLRRRARDVSSVRRLSSASSPVSSGPSC